MEEDLETRLMMNKPCSESDSFAANRKYSSTKSASGHVKPELDKIVIDALRKLTKKMKMTNDRLRYQHYLVSDESTSTTRMSIFLRLFSSGQSTMRLYNTLWLVKHIFLCFHR